MLINSKTKSRLFVIAASLLTFDFSFFTFYQTFSGHFILPQFFSIGSLSIRYYGLFMALAVAVGFYLAIKRAPKFGIEEKAAENIIFWLVIGGFLGARLYHVLSSWSYYSFHPLDILKVYNGGLSIYGVLFGGLLALLLYRKLAPHRLPLNLYLNWLTPSLLLGQIIGRFGNFFNYELYGYPTNLPWKMFVPAWARPLQFTKTDFFHPLFLYEQIGNLIILLVLYQLEKRARQQNKPSNLFIYYLLLYNILRFGLEFLRIDIVFWGQLRINALVSLVLCLVSFSFLFFKYGSRVNK